MSAADLFGLLALSVYVALVIVMALVAVGVSALIGVLMTRRGEHRV